LLPLIITGGLHAEGFVYGGDHCMILLQRVTQLRHVNVEAAIAVAGKLVKVVADAVQGREGLDKRAMLYGAAAARAGACFVQSGSTGKCAYGKASARRPFFVSRVFV